MLPQKIAEIRRQNLSTSIPLGMSVTGESLFRRTMTFFPMPRYVEVLQLINVWSTARAVSSTSKWGLPGTTYREQNSPVPGSLHRKYSFRSFRTGDGLGWCRTGAGQGMYTVSSLCVLWYPDNNWPSWWKSFSSQQAKMRGFLVRPSLKNLQ